WVVLPPVETYGLSFIDRTDKQSDTDREQFHVRKRNANVTRDHKSFIENSIKDVQQVCCSGNRRNSLHNISGKNRRDRRGLAESTRLMSPHPNQPNYKLSTFDSFSASLRTSRKGGGASAYF